MGDRKFFFALGESRASFLREKSKYLLLFLRFGKSLRVCNERNAFNLLCRMLMLLLLLRLMKLAEFILMIVIMSLAECSAFKDKAS